MDVFQLVGDFLHLIAILMLFLKIASTKNVIGISYRTQEMYLIVFLTRYSDMILENHWGSFYFNIMRFIFISITVYTIHLIKFKRPYKLVNILLFRVMIISRMFFLIIICILFLQHLLSYFMNTFPYTAYFGLSQSGFKLQQSFPSFI